MINNKTKFDNSPFSQPESRLVADWLRTRHALTIKNAFVLWRKSPTDALKWIMSVSPDTARGITPDKLAQAAGRSPMEVVNG